MSNVKAYILFPAAAGHPLYKDWLSRCPIEPSIVGEYDTHWDAPDDAGIVITHLHYRWEETSVLRRIVENERVPLLILADGIIEFRNTFEHPDLSDGAIFQPLMGHKLACIGRAQARWIESWGNVGKCEVIGMPRFDELLKSNAQPADQSPDRFRLLVASARHPYFNDQQREETIQGLRDLKSWLDEHPQIERRRTEVRWRLTDELHAEVRVPKDDDGKAPIQTVMENVDAVISTPSTVQLEAALNGRPLALLDYHNAPQFVPAAWSITAPQHIGRVICELAQPQPAKMLVQNALLYDNLQCRQPATPRLIQLIDTMVLCGRQARKEGLPLSFPARIVADEDLGFTPIEPTADLSRLFPDNSSFREQSILRLQSELSAAIKEMSCYPDKYFAQRSANRRSRSYVHWLRTILRNRAAKIEELTEQYNDLVRQMAKLSVKKD